MKDYGFTVTFYESFGSFYVEANDVNEAYEKAIAEIKEAIKDLPVSVEFEVECIDEPFDEDEEENEL